MIAVKIGLRVLPFVLMSHHWSIQTKHPTSCTGKRLAMPSMTLLRLKSTGTPKGVIARYNLLSRIRRLHQKSAENLR